MHRAHHMAGLGRTIWHLSSTMTLWAILSRSYNGTETRTASPSGVALDFQLTAGKLYQYVADVWV